MSDKKKPKFILGSQTFRIVGQNDQEFWSFIVFFGLAHWLGTRGVVNECICCLCGQVLPCTCSPRTSFRLPRLPVAAWKDLWFIVRRLRKRNFFLSVAMWIDITVLRMSVNRDRVFVFLLYANWFYLLLRSTSATKKFYVIKAHGQIVRRNQRDTNFISDHR